MENIYVSLLFVDILSIILDMYM